MSVNEHRKTEGFEVALMWGNKHRKTEGFEVSIYEGMQQDLERSS